MSKKLKYEAEIAISDEKWETLKRAFLAKDSETIHTFTAGEEFDTPTLLRILQRETSPTNATLRFWGL